MFFLTSAVSGTSGVCTHTHTGRYLVEGRSRSKQVETYFDIHDM